MHTHQNKHHKQESNQNETASHSSPRGRVVTNQNEDVLIVTAPAGGQHTPRRAAPTAPGPKHGGRDSVATTEHGTASGTGCSRRRGCSIQTTPPTHATPADALPLSSTRSLLRQLLPSSLRSSAARFSRTSPPPTKRAGIGGAAGAADACCVAGGSALVGGLLTIADDTLPTTPRIDLMMPVVTPSRGRPVTAAGGGGAGEGCAARGAEEATALGSLGDALAVDNLR